MGAPPPWFVFAVLAGMMALFFTGRWRYDLVALGGLLVLTLAGAVPADQAFSGLGHPAVLTVAAVLVLSAGLVRSGAVAAMAVLAGRLIRTKALLAPVLGTGVTLLSGVINNVGALSLVMPVGLEVGRKHGVPPSRYMMVLSFGSILGGMLLLISTPINLIVSGFRHDALGQGYGLFDFAPVGSVLAGLGLLYLITWGSRLAPEREGHSGPADLFQLERYTSEVLVTETSSLAGRRLGEVAEFQDGEVIVARVLHGRDAQIPPGPDEWLRAGDRLMVEASPETLARFVRKTGSELLGRRATRALREALAGVSLLEAVVPPGASLVGRTVRDLEIRTRYGLNVLAVARQGERIVTRLVDTTFRAGDILLLQGPDARVGRFLREHDCLPLMTREIRLGRTGSVRVALAIFVGSVLLTAALGVAVQISFALGAFLMIVTGQLNLRQAYEALELPVLVLLACMLPVGHALETSGGARLVAAGLQWAGSALPTAGLLGLMVFATALLANSMNNKAAAALMAPVALQLAGTLQSNPDAFLMGVAVGAELVFLSPLGHQSNLLVMGPAGYGFGDFFRMGAPLLILLTLAAGVVVPLFWPL